MKISIMKAGLCLAGQLSNLTKWKIVAVFMDGKHNGKKKTLDKFLMLLHNKLQPKDYVRLPSFQNRYLYE